MSTLPTTDRVRHESLLPAALVRTLDHVRRRHLMLALAEFPVLLIAGLASAWTLQALADRLLDIPWSARCVLLALDAAGAAWLFDHCIMIPWKRRLDRKGAALLVERSMPEFQTSLISAVELASPEDDTPNRSRPLVEKLVADVAERIETSNVVANVLTVEPFKRLAVRSAVPVMAAMTLLVACRPVSALLLSRILLGTDALPTDTTVISISGDLVVDEGGDAQLVARAEGEQPLDGKLVITQSGRSPETLTLAASGAPAAEFNHVLRDVRREFTYQFFLNDGTGRVHRVNLRHPPTPKTLNFVAVPPAYTGLPETEVPPTAMKLLEGSTLRMQGISSKPLRGGQVRIKGADAEIPLKLVPTDAACFTCEIPVPAEGWKSLAVHLTGLDGDESSGDPVYPVELIRDRPPTVTLHTPKDETSTVVANDRVPIDFEAVDDFGFTSATLVYQVFRLLPDGGTEQAAEGRVPMETPTGKRVWKHRFSWDLGLLMPTVTTGYSISFSIETTDNKTPEPGTGHSATHTLNVISEQAKRLELLELLAAKAAEIEQLYEQQKAIQSRTEGGNP